MSNIPAAAPRKAQFKKQDVKDLKKEETAFNQVQTKDEVSQILKKRENEVRAEYRKKLELQYRQ